MRRFWSVLKLEKKQLLSALQLLRELTSDLIQALKPFKKYLMMVALIGLLLMVLSGCSQKRVAIQPSPEFLKEISCVVDVSTYRSIVESLKRCEQVAEQHNTDKQAIKLELGVE